MKNIIRFALLSATVTAVSQAAPFVAIGDGAELFLTGGLTVRADDNIFLTEKSESDLIFDITPGVDITFGKDAQLKGALTLSHMFTNYSDNSNLNTNLFSGDFFTRYDDGKMKLGFNIGYHELNQNSVDIRGLTRRDTFAAGGNAEVEVSAITSVAAGLQFNHENYKRANYTDADSLTIPLDFYYKWTPKVDLSVGYRYRDYRVDNLGDDSTDHFFNVGGRGEFSPKLTGKFAVGLNTRNLDRGGDETQLGLDASVAYEISPKTSLQVGASNDFGTSPGGEQQKNFTLNGMVMTKLTEEWSINAGLSYRAIDYGTRTDDFIEGTLGASYIVNANVRVVGGYTYRNYSSDIRGSDFENNVFSVGANLRY